MSISLTQLLQTSDQLLVLTFEAAEGDRKLRLCLNIHKIKEVMEFEAVSPLPSESQPFYGLVDYRGTPLPMVHVNRLISAEAEECPSKGKAMVIEVQSQWIAVVISTLGTLRHHRFSDVEPVPVPLQGDNQKFLSGVIPEKDGYLYLFDIESALDAAGVRLTPKAAASENVSTLRGKRILLVEDSVLFQKRISQLLRQWGCEVTVASNGREGLQALEKSRPFDLIFSDLEMPIMSGLEMAGHIRQSQQWSNIPILFNSSLSNPIFVEEIKKSQIGRYIVKFDPDAIEKELVLLLSSQSEKVAS